VWIGGKWASRDWSRQSFLENFQSNGPWKVRHLEEQMAFEAERLQ